MRRRVALMFQPGQGNGPPTWLVTLLSEVRGFRRQGWFLLGHVTDTRRQTREVAVEPPPRRWRLRRRKRRRERPPLGSTGE